MPNAMNRDEKVRIYKRADTAQGRYYERFGYSYTGPERLLVQEMRRIMPTLGSNPNRVPAVRMIALEEAAVKLENALKEGVENGLERLETKRVSDMGS